MGPLHVTEAMAVVSLFALIGCNSSVAPPASTIPDSSPPLGPGCLGAPDESCSPYPEGTLCPGPPTVCVSCGAGIYTPSQSVCRCTSGTWSCAPPPAGEVHCSSPVGQFVDPSCSVLSDGDAGMDATPETGAADGGVDAGAEAGADATLDG
jgi:hypothetical protein